MVKNILVVEDDADLRSVVKEQLDGAGYNVLEAANGQVALKIVADQRVDLIVTDIDMPIKNGLELLEEIKRNHADIVVIVMTGGNHNEQFILGAGAHAFIQKPFVIDIGTVIRKMTAA
jgi:two-component system, chemotaxis family, chemotaxis protein CheY